MATGSAMTGAWFVHEIWGSCLINGMMVCTVLTSVGNRITQNLWVDII